MLIAIVLFFVFIFLMSYVPLEDNPDTHCTCKKNPANCNYCKKTIKRLFRILI